MGPTLTANSQEVLLNATHRCDRCSARAFILVRGKSGELMFCGHHYNSIMDNAVGYDKMIKFAIEIIDQRGFEKDDNTI
jgi:hypothetical protein